MKVKYGKTYCIQLPNFPLGQHIVLVRPFLWVKLYPLNRYQQPGVLGSMSNLGSSYPQNMTDFLCTCQLSAPESVFRVLTSHPEFSWPVDLGTARATWLMELGERLLLPLRLIRSPLHHWPNRSENGISLSQEKSLLISRAMLSRDLTKVTG